MPCLTSDFHFVCIQLDGKVPLQGRALLSSFLTAAVPDELHEVFPSDRPLIARVQLSHDELDIIRGGFQAKIVQEHGNGFWSERTFAVSVDLHTHLLEPNLPGWLFCTAYVSSISVRYIIADYQSIQELGDTAFIEDYIKACSRGTAGKDCSDEAWALKLAAIQHLNEQLHRLALHCGNAPMKDRVVGHLIKMG